MKMTCKVCCWNGTEETVLQAPNPFDANEKIYGCPSCKTVNDFEESCDHGDCWAPASIGTPTREGYKRLCSRHGQPYLRALQSTGDT